MSLIHTTSVYRSFPKIDVPTTPDECVVFILAVVCTIIVNTSLLCYKRWLALATIAEL